MPELFSIGSTASQLTISYLTHLTTRDRRFSAANFVEQEVVERQIERFHRTLAAGWAYARYYGSETAPPRSTPPAALSQSPSSRQRTGALPLANRLVTLPEHHSLLVPGLETNWC